MLRFSPTGRVACFFAHFSSGTCFWCIRTTLTLTVTLHSFYTQKKGGSKSCRHYHRPQTRLQPLRVHSTPLLSPTTPPSLLPSTTTTTSSTINSSSRSNSTRRSRSAVKQRSVTTRSSRSMSSSIISSSSRNYMPSVPSLQLKTLLFDSIPTHKAKPTTSSCTNGGRKCFDCSKRGRLTR